jgi:hypothetical protein
VAPDFVWVGVSGEEVKTNFLGFESKFEDMYQGMKELESQG